jgi:hypothetical protein
MVAGIPPSMRCANSSMHVGVPHVARASWSGWFSAPVTMLPPLPPPPSDAPPCPPFEAAPPPPSPPAPPAFAAPVPVAFVPDASRSASESELHPIRTTSVMTTRPCKRSGGEAMPMRAAASMPARRPSPTANESAEIPGRIGPTRGRTHPGVGRRGWHAPARVYVTQGGAFGPHRKMMSRPARLRGHHPLAKRRARRPRPPCRRTGAGTRHRQLTRAPIHSKTP